MQITPGQTHLIILLVSVIAIYYFYPEYFGIITPLFIAITLFFATNDMIVSMFSVIPTSTTNLTNFIIKYKLYIIIALACISAYYTNSLFKKEKYKSRNIEDLNTSDIDSNIFESSEPSFLKSNNSDLDMEDIEDMEFPSKSKSKSKQLYKDDMSL